MGARVEIDMHDALLSWFLGRSNTKNISLLNTIWLTTKARSRDEEMADALASSFWNTKAFRPIWPFKYSATRLTKGEPDEQGLFNERKSISESGGSFYVLLGHHDHQSEFSLKTGKTCKWNYLLRWIWWAKDAYQLRSSLSTRWSPWRLTIVGGIRGRDRFEFFNLEEVLWSSITDHLFRVQNSFVSIFVIFFVARELGLLSEHLITAYVRAGVWVGVHVLI